MKTWPECETCKVNGTCMNQITENPCSNVVFELKEEHIVKSENLRQTFLDEVSKIVCEGAKHYNVAENSYSDIAKMWGVYLKREITSVDVCMLMALLKVVRTRNNPKRTDSLVDLAGYAAGAFEEINS